MNYHRTKVGTVYVTDASGVPDDCEPVVVISPEDRGTEAERLWLTLRDGRALQSRDNLTAALREFANPTPPKPDEPTGLGAVVEDAEGRRWVHAPDDALDDEPWVLFANNPDGGECVGYHRIAAVRVLSEGVTS